MKTSSLYLLLFLLLASLTISGQKKQKYIIHGTLPDKSLDGSYVRLIKESFEKEFITLDSAKIQNGKFIFKGKTTKESFLTTLLTPEKKIGHLIIEPGEINIVCSSYDQLANVSGTPINNTYNKDIIIPFQIFQQANRLLPQKEKGIKEGTWTEDDEIHYMEMFPYELFQACKDKQWDFIENHLQYPEVVIQDITSQYMIYATEIKGTELLSKDAERLKNIFSKLPEETVNRIYRYQDLWEKQLAEYIKNNQNKPVGPKEVVPEAVQVGKTFTDFSGETPDGKQITLSELVKNNKLVLIDFWASWCGPCMKEMPVIAGLYKEYKDKGLEILGISSDQTSQQWMNALEKNNMDWLQIRSAGENAIGIKYGIKYIPYTILIDQNGTIVARRLRGEQLQQKIKELLE